MYSCRVYSEQFLHFNKVKRVHFVTQGGRSWETTGSQKDRLFSKGPQHMLFCRKFKFCDLFAFERLSESFQLKSLCFGRTSNWTPIHSPILIMDQCMIDLTEHQHYLNQNFSRNRNKNISQKFANMRSRNEHLVLSERLYNPATVLQPVKWFLQKMGAGCAAQHSYVDATFSYGCFYSGQERIFMNVI